jgi:hypothetical protein
VNWQTITGISSAVIALCALALTVCQAWTTRRHNRLSVKPHLDTWSDSDEVNNNYTVKLLNNGIGPAVIKSFEIQVDGQPVVGEGVEPVKKTLKILFPEYQYDSHQSYVAPGYVMAAKEAHDLASVTFRGQKVPRPEEVRNAIKKARLLIHYESFYGDKYHT